jgi:hypothetical protein
MYLFQKYDNVFTAALNVLQVKHTRDFSNEYFNRHPHKYNLFGISEMLFDYGVSNGGVMIENKETDIHDIECPFVAHTGSDFVVVYKIDAHTVYYLWNGTKISIPVTEFIRTWSGAILLTETDSGSIEPGYKENRKKERVTIFQKTAVCVAGITMFGTLFFHQALYANPALSLLLPIHALGIYICYLLVKKQMRIQSRYADKICSFFSKKDCNNVLESGAAKLWNTFGWSEIGLGYFTANFLLLSFLPQSVSVLALINLFTLPYTFWSIWYQKTKAGQWCPLCLMIQALLWILFLTNLYYGHIHFTEFTTIGLAGILFTGCLFTIFIIALNLIIPAIGKGEELEQVKQEINSLKANENIFRFLLEQQPAYETSPADSRILLGTKEARLQVTILTNPYCNPCARLHGQVNKLVNDSNGEVRIQYIFSSFNKNLEFAARYLIAAYLEKGQNEFGHIISGWFEKGKPLKEAFFSGLRLNMSNPEIESEFRRHKAWIERTRLNATPTIIVNGYKLPDNYKIEDLKYFTAFNVNVK